MMGTKPPRELVRDTMEARIYRWDEIAEDNPIPLLTRKMVLGEQALVAKVKLAAGCRVAEHHHVSEQIAIVISGRARWTLGKERREVELVGGDVLHLPSNEPHSVLALEDTEAIDILSPPGPMGVDSQGRGH